MASDRIPTIYPVALDGMGGPVQSCIRIALAMHGQGVSTPLFLLRNRVEVPPLDIMTGLPRWSVHLPRNRVQPFGRRRVERLFLQQTRPEDLCVLWPGISVDLVRTLKKRGNPVVLEAINTPMRHARQVLDQAYARIGVPQQHGITENRIREEEDIFDLVDAIFCPSPAVEAALADIGFSGSILPTNRGIGNPAPVPPDRGDRPDEGRLLCLFVGMGNIRKGVDRLLELWPSLPENLYLRIVGRLEPAIAEHYRAALAHPRIEAVGFSRDVARHYAEADVFVFPSREEGDPKVTYEAANAGLPLVVSSVGGGRFLQETGACLEIDPEDPNSISEALIQLSRNREARLALGRRAWNAVQTYTWDHIARRRLAMLQDAFPAYVPLGPSRER